MTGTAKPISKWPRRLVIVPPLRQMEWAMPILTAEQSRDRSQLEREAHQYALRFSAEEDTHRYRIEVSNFSTNRAFIYSIEAARCLATGEEDVALRLLEMQGT